MRIQYHALFHDAQRVYRARMRPRMHALILMRRGCARVPVPFRTVVSLLTIPEISIESLDKS